MFKAVIGKLTCGVALLVGFVACGASDEANEDFTAPITVDGTEVSEGEASANTQNEAVDEAAAVDEAVAGTEGAVEGDADTSASVEPSGFVLVDCFANLRQCFPVRDALFESSGLICVCQSPDTDQNCGGVFAGLVDLECNI